MTKARLTINWVMGGAESTGWAYRNNMDRLTEVLSDDVHFVNKLCTPADVAFFFDGLIYHQHGLRSRATYKCLRLSGPRPIQRLFQDDRNAVYRFLQEFDAVVALNHELDALGHSAGVRTRLIPNGLDLTKWRGAHQSSAKGFVVGFAGDTRPAEKKGYDVAEEACAIVGVPLTAGIKDPGGRIPHRSMQANFYHRVSCLLHPSRPGKEGCSNVVMEALASGTPVITTPYAGYHAELLTDGEDALIIEPDAGAAAEAIERLRSDSVLRRRLSERGRAFAEAHHDIRVVAHDYRELFASLASQPREIASRPVEGIAPGKTDAANWGTAGQGATPAGAQETCGTRARGTVTFDLRGVFGDSRSADEERLVQADLLAVLRPRRLRRLLRQRYDAVNLVLDAPRPSAVQGMGLLVGALLRARRVAVERAGRTRQVRKPGLIVRGIAAILGGVPREVGARVALRYRLARLGRPRPNAAPSSCERLLYLRGYLTLQGNRYAGSAAAHTTGVVNGMTASDVQVEILADEVPEGLRDAQVVAVPPHRSYTTSWLTASAQAARMARLAKGREADVVYERCTLGSIAGLEVAARLGAPLVVEFNSSELSTAGDRGTGKLRASAMTVEIEQRSLEGATLIIVVSPTLKEELVRRGIPAEKILVNPNGIDLGALASYREAAPETWRQRLGLPDHPTIGFIGTFGSRDGTDLLAALAEQVQADNPEARWIFFGGSQHEARLRREAEARGLADRILLPGLMPYEQGLAFLAACDICVAPNIEGPDGSRFLMSPIKPPDYMGLGRAIVAARPDEAAEILEDGVTALVHEPGDIERAAEQIATLLSDERMRQRLGDAAFAEAQRRYTWQAHSRRILDALMQ